MMLEAVTGGWFFSTLVSTLAEIKNKCAKSFQHPRSSLRFSTCHKPFNFLWLMAGTTGLEPATSAVTVLDFEVFQRLTNRGERLRPPKSCKTIRFVDWIVDRNFRSCRRFSVVECIAWYRQPITVEQVSEMRTLRTCGFVFHHQ
jgi:hypothetical protein